MTLIAVRLSGFLSQQGVPSGFKGGPLELPDSAKVVDALTAMGIGERTPWLVTLNGELAESETRLEDGDILVIIPPISGGTHWGSLSCPALPGWMS